MDPGVQIRFATAADSGQIVEVLFEAFSTYRAFYTPEAFAIVTPKTDEIIRRFDEGPQWVAVKDDEVLGTVSVLPEPEWLYIRSMAVKPTAQGLGIGHKLMDSIEKYAIEKEFDRLFLYTTYFSNGAIELYERHGFKRGRDTTAEEWYGTPGLEMSKTLERKNKQNAIGS